MRITKYGHACLFIEEGEAHILIDPGAYSHGFEGLTTVGAIFITHQHSDHLEIGNIRPLLAKNPTAKVYSDEESAVTLSGQGVPTQVVRAGDVFDVAGVQIQAIGTKHALIHVDVPQPANVGYIIAGRFFYPGDNFTNPERPIEILAAPAGAPWLKVGEVVDYIRLLKPKIAIPVHDAVLAIPEMNYGLMTRLTQKQGIEVRVVSNGESIEV